MTSTLLLCTFAVLVMRNVRDWTLWAPGCGSCGAKRKGRHAKDCPMKDHD